MDANSSTRTTWVMVTAVILAAVLLGIALIVGEPVLIIVAVAVAVVAGLAAVVLPGRAGQPISFSEEFPANTIGPRATTDGDSTPDDQHPAAPGSGTPRRHPRSRDAGRAGTAGRRAGLPAVREHRAGGQAAPRARPDLRGDAAEHRVGGRGRGPGRRAPSPREECPTSMNSPPPVSTAPRGTRRRGLRRCRPASRWRSFRTMRADCGPVIPSFTKYGARSRSTAALVSQPAASS